MIKILKTIILFLFCNLSYAQDTVDLGVEKNVTGVQIGLMGLDAYNEHKIGEKFVLRSSFNLIGGFWAGTYYPKPGYALWPAITIQPKYYFNINKRAKKGKNTTNNSANYFSLQTRFSPRWFVISNYDDMHASKIKSLSFIPTFGIRRSFGENFNYEFKVGYGYVIDFNKRIQSNRTFDLGFKIGYDF